MAHQTPLQSRKLSINPVGHFRYPRNLHKSVVLHFSIEWIILDLECHATRIFCLEPKSVNLSVQIWNHRTAVWSADDTIAELFVKKPLAYLSHLTSQHTKPRRTRRPDSLKYCKSKRMSIMFSPWPAASVRYINWDVNHVLAFRGHTFYICNCACKCAINQHDSIYSRISILLRWRVAR